MQVGILVVQAWEIQGDGGVLENGGPDSSLRSELHGILDSRFRGNDGRRFTLSLSKGERGFRHMNRTGAALREEKGTQCYARSVVLIERDVEKPEEEWCRVPRHHRTSIR